MAIVNRLPISGGGLKMELLWSNPNPNSSYSSHELDIDLSDYDYVAVKFKVNTSNSREITVISKISELATSDTPRPKMAGAYYASNGTTYYRNCGITSTGKFEFYQCYYGSTSSNSNVIPLAIYGGKGKISY